MALRKQIQSHTIASLAARPGVPTRYFFCAVSVLFHYQAPLPHYQEVEFPLPPYYQTLPLRLPHAQQQRGPLPSSPYYAASQEYSSKAPLAPQLVLSLSAAQALSHYLLGEAEGKQ